MPFVSPFAPRISDLIAQRAETTGNTVASLGQIVAQAVGQYAQAKQQEPIRKLQQAQAADQLREVQSKPAQRLAQSAALTPDGTLDRGALTKSYTAMGLADHLPALFESLDHAEEATLRVKKLSADMAAAKKDALASAAWAALRASAGNDELLPQAVDKAIGMLDTNGILSQDEAMKRIGPLMHEPANLRTALTTMALSSKDIRDKASQPIKVGRKLYDPISMKDLGVDTPQTELELTMDAADTTSPSQMESARALDLLRKNKESSRAPGRPVPVMRNGVRVYDTPENAVGQPAPPPQPNNPGTREKRETMPDGTIKVTTIPNTPGQSWTEPKVTSAQRQGFDKWYTAQMNTLDNVKRASARGSDIQQLIQSLDPEVAGAIQSSKMTDAEFAAAKSRIDKTYERSVGEPYDRPATPAPAPAPAKATAGKKTAVESSLKGKTKTLKNGKRVKITAVYSDGTFDADPVD